MYGAASSTLRLRLDTWTHAQVYITLVPKSPKMRIQSLLTSDILLSFSQALRALIIAWWPEWESMYSDWDQGNLMNVRTLPSHWNVSPQWGSASSEIWIYFPSETGIRRHTTPSGGPIRGLSIANNFLENLMCWLGNSSLSQKRTLLNKFLHGPTIAMMACFFISFLLYVRNWCTLSPEGWWFDWLAKYIHPRRDSTTLKRTGMVCNSLVQNLFSTTKAALSI
jgi:hypothetical protein